MRIPRPGPGTSLFLLHIAVAMAYRHFAGFQIESALPWGGWDWFWQTLPMEDLRTDLACSILNLHSQPPLLNLYGGILGKLFHPHHLTALGYLQILLGGLAVLLCHRLLMVLTGSGRVAFFGGLFLALLPGFFLYEAYLLYTLPAAFLVLLSVERLSRSPGSPGMGPLLGFVAALTLLILLRSVFHLALLGLALPFGCLLAGHRWPRFLMLALLIASPAVLWCVKNQVRFGFFGSSSWTGQGVFRAVSHRRSTDELRRCEPMVAELGPFSRPSEYRQFGFDREFESPVLSRDDFNNGNIPDISAVYGQASSSLIRSDPGAYLDNVLLAYALYCGPSTRYMHVKLRARKMQGHERSYRWLLTLGGLTERYGSLYYALIPVLLLVVVLAALVRCGVSPAKWTACLRADPATAFGWLLVLYTTLVGCLFELGENERFKFMIEPLLLVLTIALIHRLFRAARSRDRQPLLPGEER